jgi:hypothetical protein
MQASAQYAIWNASATSTDPSSVFEDLGIHQAPE